MYICITLLLEDVQVEVARSHTRCVPYPFEFQDPVSGSVQVCHDDIFCEDELCIFFFCQKHNHTISVIKFYSNKSQKGSTYSTL